jgi:hypothetical protein
MLKLFSRQTRGTAYQRAAPRACACKSLGSAVSACAHVRHHVPLVEMRRETRVAAPRAESIS